MVGFTREERYVEVVKIGLALSITQAIVLSAKHDCHIEEEKEAKPCLCGHVGVARVQNVNIDQGHKHSIID